MNCSVVSIAMAHDVAEMTLIPRPLRGREPVPVQISRLLHAHEIVLKEARTMARLAAQGGDDGQTTCWSVVSYERMSCRCGSSPNTS